MRTAVASLVAVLATCVTPARADAATCRPWPGAGQPGVYTPASCYTGGHRKWVKVKVKRHGVWVVVKVRVR